VFDLLPILKARRRQYAGSLSGGEQQIVAIGRTLMAKPELPLLDEQVTANGQRPFHNASLCGSLGGHRKEALASAQSGGRTDKEIVLSLSVLFS
jgi:ABC-type branched-subunit amino acid transport system ATPase component